MLACKLAHGLLVLGLSLSIYICICSQTYSCPVVSTLGREILWVILCYARCIFWWSDVVSGTVVLLCVRSSQPWSDEQLLLACQGSCLHKVVAAVS